MVIVSMQLILSFTSNTAVLAFGLKPYFKAFKSDINNALNCSMRWLYDMKGVTGISNLTLQFPWALQTV